MLAWLLTLLFTFATFAAPGACCCPPKSPAPVSTISERAPPVKRSCCHAAKPPVPRPLPADKKSPAKSPASKCPCLELRAAPAMPPAPFDAATADFSWSLDFEFAFPTPGRISIASSGTHSRPHRPKPISPSGRELLAAYSTLRC